MTSGTCFDEGKPLFMGSVAGSLLTSGACFDEDKSLFRGSVAGRLLTSGACVNEDGSLFRDSVAGSLYTLCRQVCRIWDLSRGLSPGRRLLQENKVLGWGTRLAQGTPSRSIPE